MTYRVDEHTNYPIHFSGEVIVTLKDGRRIAHREPINRGAADNPVSDAGIAAKYHENAQLTTSAAHAARVRDLILDLDGLDDARVLASALAPEAAP